MKDDEMKAMMDAIDQGSQDSREMISPGDFDVIEDVDFKPPVEFEPGEGKAIEVEDQLDDFSLARKTYHNIIANGHTALDQLLKVAVNSDHPRAYEVVSTMMKTIGDSAKDLLKLQEQMVDLRNKMRVDTEQDEREINEEGGFEGTTEQLLAEIEKEKKDADVS